MDNTTFLIPEAAWKRKFVEPLTEVKKPSRVPSIGAILKILPMIVRLYMLSRKQKSHGFDPISLSAPRLVNPYNGIPLGGLGSGSIGRGWRGEFRRWQLHPGTVIQEPVWANQFSIFVQSVGGFQSEADQPAQGIAQVLFPGRPEDGSLSAWNWNMPMAAGEYAALFPRSWTTYSQPISGVNLTCRQISPVIPHNYQESSYPVSEFHWKVENTNDHPITVSIMFTFQNGLGLPDTRDQNYRNEPFTLETPEGPLHGITLHQTYQQKQTSSLSETNATGEVKTVGLPLSFAIAGRPIGAGIVTRRNRFKTRGNGSDLWNDFSTRGMLDEPEFSTEPATGYENGEPMGAAVAVTVALNPGETREVSFSLAWDMPHVYSGFGAAYLRRYTRFYGTDGTAAAKIACDALFSAPNWEAQVEAWQQPVLNNPDLPAWYRMALFNELYYLVDGGTIWAYPEDPKETIPDAEMGHFAYLESHDYRMYNTYDVHFYASFALVQLWPKLELALQRDIAAATLTGYPDEFTELYSGKTVPRKQFGAVPHDIGWFDEDPWRKVNGYFIHDVNQWKDLNAKFILQIYRDVIASGEKAFARELWPAVEAALTHLRQFDRDGDGMIENDGFPDQTYDVWPVKGPSAYTGGLWLACLEAAICLAEINNKPEVAKELGLILEKGKQVYEAKLWNGRYYQYDSSNSPQHDSIMTDQMAGQWYARACGLPSIVDPKNARSALITIHDWNVQRFLGGQFGAINGMRPNGLVDQSSMQSQEVWTGVTYAAAAAMIQEGLTGEAFATAWGIVRHTYLTGSGYWFQTPEAWDSSGDYRAIAYMRPLAIWAMQWAIDQKSQSENSKQDPPISADCQKNLVENEES